MDAKLKAYVTTLLVKAVNANEAHNAMHFAQAACNAANALRALIEVEHAEKQS